MRKSHAFTWLSIGSYLVLMFFSYSLVSAQDSESFPAQSLTEEKEVFFDVPFWYPQQGDYFVADVTNNIGYLMHLDGTSYSFPIITGQTRYVYYLGRYYYGATPVRSWEMKSIDIKDDRVTFGPTGRFLRLYFRGESTSYGIHGHRDTKFMLESGDLYRSYGCIIVEERILDMIEKIYKNNDNYLRVETFAG